jgi:uncharacterized protein
MHYHILLTEECDSRCRYCYEKSFREFDNGLDKKFKFCFSSEESKLEIKKLKEFILSDSEAVIIFYGGEPLLRIDLIKTIIDNIDVPFRMQTNGKLLNQLPIKYLRKIDKILISIDGTKERTDFNRGEGTFDLVMKNIENARKQGYRGEFIARMTIDQDFPDLCEQATFLHKKGFQSLHWQIDCGFYKFDFNKKKIEKFFEEYNKQIKHLINYWIKKIESSKVLKFYPFLGIVNSLLKNQPTKLRCGAGHSGYAITLNGDIFACPIMNSIENFKAGNIESSPKGLKQFSCDNECSDCDYYSLCGGRCLYWRKAKLWPKEGDEMICDSIKFLIDELKNQLPRIEKALKTRKISIQDLEYEKYFGPEIIP